MKPIKTILFFLITLIILPGFLFNPPKKKFVPTVKITWVKNLEGDFSFTKNREYPMGVEKKEDGKAGCADGGFCPERCYNMLDTNGIVLKDSSEIFYQLLDTSHIPYSIQCDAWCYEYAGTNIISATRISKNTIRAVTATNIATHCSLTLEIDGEYCTPSVFLNSITPEGNKQFYYKSGNITIDEKYFKKNILKAEFDLTFTNVYEPSRPVYWKGKIYAAIKKEK